ncbi:MAG: inositol monophosphatase [Deltaproteobacteria bacterium]|nr:inositol monophosphatase [Deltaproteobacteria bacterium]MCB9788752.1 inositol monophosphatase [Deltaproteobacteria bacterium]
MDERLELARGLAGRAGDELMRWFGRTLDVDRKGAVDLVTDADRAAEALIARGLADAFPDDAFLGEETGRSGPADAPWCWVVDPLDGTTNFVHGLPRFAVSIGAWFRGAPALGVVVAPAEGHVYAGATGRGATRDGEPMRVSTTDALGDSLLATGFPYDRRDTVDALLRPLRSAMLSGQGVRRMGAAALDLVDVARGAFDGYWEPRLSPWDVAAGVVLVREAGGVVTGPGGRPFDPARPDIVASNGHIHAALVSALACD